MDGVFALCAAAIITICSRGDPLEQPIGRQSIPFIATVFCVCVGVPIIQLLAWSLIWPTPDSEHLWLPKLILRTQTCLIATAIGVVLTATARRAYARW
jgi:hypothetical protein